MKPRIPSTTPTKGFALVVTLTLMVLLSVLAVGLLSLSSVTLRNAAVDSAQNKAKANARLALMIAIGKLQAELGPDQRISANASILDATPETSAAENTSNPHWMGVWESWKAGGTSGSAHNTIEGISDGNMHPSYEGGRASYFRAWMVSMDETRSGELLSHEDPALTNNPSVKPGIDHNAVTLVGMGSLAADKEDEKVTVPLVDIESDDTGGGIIGRYGWWVGDESQKALITKDPLDSADAGALTVAEKMYHQYAPGSTGSDLLGGLEYTDGNELDRLPGLRTLDLLDGVSADSLPSMINFHHATVFSKGVLCDVREGGLKRDLGILLEQPIDQADVDYGIDPFILYEFDDPRFNDRRHSRVPVQDLAAYYQLYQDDRTFASSRRGGVEYGNSLISVRAPDFGDNPANRDVVDQKYMREYTTLYRNLIPIRVQFVVGIYADPISDFDRRYEGWSNSTALRERNPPIPDRLTHKLVTTITPVITAWNPNNVSMTLQRGKAFSQVMKMTPPALYLRWTKFPDGQANPLVSDPVNMMYMAVGHYDANSYSEMASMAFSDETEVTFEPGEVKIFSIPTNGLPLQSQEVYESGSHGSDIASTRPGWDPSGLMPMRHSATGGTNRDIYTFLPSDNYAERRDTRELITFGPNDAITFGLYPEDTSGGQSNPSRHSKVAGAAFNFWLMNYNYTPWRNSNSGEHLINYMFTTRGAGRQGGGGRLENTTASVPFNQQMMRLGFPDGLEALEPETTASESISGQDIISASLANETFTLFQYTVTAASEVHGDHMALANAGRSRPSRPFLHGSTITPAFVDQLDPSSLYTFGWEWQTEKINSMDSAPIQHDGEKSYYGGGYNAEYGNTHVVQREIPVLPPISIAALSHAHLGGFSLGDEPAVEFNNLATKGLKRGLRDITRSQGYQRVTAFGQGGLAPHTLQAIGNSYAHPKIPADKAFTTWRRLFDYDETAPTTNMNGIEPPDSWGGEYDVPCVDHSYLANKALWDEYFFSSITPQLSSVPLYGGGAESAAEVAEYFFFHGQPLPNTRFEPYKVGLTEQIVEEMFDESDDPLRENGPFDSVAAYMMVNGPFNINSTSVEAWKAFLSSHREKAIQFYNGSSSTPAEIATTGTPVGIGGMTNLDSLVSTADTSDPKDQEQWRTWRSIGDDEIEQLAQAIVHQVKLRGPFLSLSEFVNRRLEPHDPDTGLSLKGALQAALDFEGEGEIPEVTINRNFRAGLRSLDDELTPAIRNDANTRYPEAMAGPAGYGSATYVDQADLLRGLASQLTPRGDTFVIRTYGDALEPGGKVLARAWCEAVVQRTPGYLDPGDEDHAAQEQLTSPVNQNFGRKFNIVSFRWLNADEV